MDYEKLHKDTINRLQQMVSCGKITVEVARGICADFIPESEDERTWIINYLSNRELNSSIIAEKENLKEAIAWLEKQGEQKPLDTIEVKVTDEVKIGETQIYLEDDGGEPPYDGIQWLDLSCMEYEIPRDKFKDRNKVEVFIRKTQKVE